MQFPINNQEEFDAAVTETYGNVADLQGQIQTLTGERDTHAATITDLQGQIQTLTGERDTHATTIADLQGQIKGMQLKELKQGIAQKKGIPIEMASRLTGETEDEINADADALAGIFQNNKGTLPLADQGGAGGNNSNLLSETLSALRGE